MDFSTSSVKQILDFFMYLYQDQNRRPSTIDGYKTTFVDILGPAGFHIFQSFDLSGLLPSFHSIFPKVPGIPQSGTFLFLNELTKHSFEPMKNTDLKHLALKTAFMLALASGKRRSKICAWVANKVSNLGQWGRYLFPPLQTS